MSDEKFERLMKDAAETYRRPTEPPLDEMWTAIEAEAFGRSIVPLPRRSLVNNPWLRMAAVLVLGVAIGRFSERATPAPAVESVAANATGNEAYQLVTQRYLGQTVTLLAALPNQLQNDRVDSSFMTKANEALATTRLLMDSPAARDPRLRALFEDLELVLVQVVRMPDRRNAVEASLIQQALQERSVMPRLRDAVADPTP